MIGVRRKQQWTFTQGQYMDVHVYGMVCHALVCVTSKHGQLIPMYMGMYWGCAAEITTLTTFLTIPLFLILY